MFEQLRDQVNSATDRRAVAESKPAESAKRTRSRSVDLSRDHEDEKKKLADRLNAAVEKKKKERTQSGRKSLNAPAKKSRNQSATRTLSQ